MSENEVHKGVLTPVDILKGDIEDFLKAEFKIKEVDFTDFGSDIIGAAYGVGYIVADDKLYHVNDTVLDPYGFDESEKNNDGSIEYVTMFYNGGAHITEVLEQIIKENK